jgi:hypothetical protein
LIHKGGGKTDTNVLVRLEHPDAPAASPERAPSAEVAPLEP